MKNQKICVIGCGNLGRSIVKGLLNNDVFSPSHVTATRRNIDLIADLATEGATVTSDNCEAVKNSNIILIAVKPYNVGKIIKEIKGEIIEGKHVLVSLATGLTTEEISEMLDHKIPVFRAMPNIAANISESTTCICSKNASQAETKNIKAVFDCVGESLIINEELMEAATILGACGIAFVFRFIRAMIQGGIQIGFDANTAKQIVSQTVKGAAEMLQINNDHPESEIDKVTTPKGCTIVGLNEMEHQGFSSALIKGIVTSFQKIEK
ncbi:pyrroline-5-carboxylate reductase [Labilibaculum manganireducens]|uniref:Pyrroline-5-carboxylate reductase n=1 Tax=Labilibaculum manganireducens TaxID=1940525 RepID=A0A2N3IHA7_9BACT|nr:pyrroline-5-carboxylate reductase [Labilibaculum manganireducens]PKQ69603.1 pyrroline-5-carboxylate reductase [Labilibaculum manganireducens]